MTQLLIGLTAALGAALLVLALVETNHRSALRAAIIATVLVTAAALVAVGGVLVACEGDS